MNLFRSLAAGAVAGAIGTVAMDLLWYRRYRRAQGEEGFVPWEFAQDVEGWETASAPGQVGKKVEELVLQRTPPDTWARPTTNVVHWATGAGWGINLALAQIVLPRSRWLGLALGPVAWLTSYAVLPLFKVYKFLRCTNRSGGTTRALSARTCLRTSSTARSQRQASRCSVADRIPHGGKTQKSPKVARPWGYVGRGLEGPVPVAGAGFEPATSRL